MDEQPTTAKRTLTEAQIRALAEGRKKSFETRKKKREVKEAIIKEKKEKLEKDYEEKVLKKKQAPPPEQVVEVEEEGSETESEHEEAVAPVPSPPEPNYKQIYYRKKVALLEQYEQQAQAQVQAPPTAYHYQGIQQPVMGGQYQYAQPSPMAHAEQIARATLKKKANEAIQAQAYRSIFPV